MCIDLHCFVFVAAALSVLAQGSLPLSSIYCGLKVGMSCENMDAYESHLAFARRSVWGSIFNPIYVVRPPISIPGGNIPMIPKPCGVLAVPAPVLEDEDGTDDKPGALRIFRAKRTITGRSWESLLNSQRVAAIRKWAGIIMSYLNFFEIGRQWDRLTPMGQALGDGLKHIFAGKATGTLHARASPILRYVLWCDNNGIPAFPLSEPAVYRFMCDHSDTAAPTFLRSYLVAVRFSFHVLGVTGGESVLNSKRVEGCAREAFLKKRRTLQKDPLTVAMVEHLERVVMTDRYLDRDKVAAGCFLLCVYFRARFSDMMNLQDLILDEVIVDGVAQGYIEGKVGRTKSAYTTEMKTRYLPMVAPRYGVTGLDWFTSWREACVRSGKPRGESMPMLPYPTANGWTRSPVGAGEGADWLRQVLRVSGIPMDALANIGTHSLKTTTLSWMAKFGAPISIRQHLGYHMANADKMALLYSRDASAGPIRQLEECIAHVRSRTFLPDSTRSGYFPGRVMSVEPNAGADSGSQPPEEHAHADWSESDSEDSGDDEHGYEEQRMNEEALDHVVGRWNEHATLEALGLQQDAPLFRNRFTRYIHLLADEAGAKFRCGRDVSSKYEELPTRPKFMSPQCKQCFREALD